MRSRFSAYALGKTRYIMETTHAPRADTEAWRAEIKQFCAATRFEGLSIEKVEPGEPEAWVTFRAVLSQDGRDASFTERSRFVLSDDWRYADGERL